MRILIHGEKFVDFEAPINMRENQKKKFIEFMGILFNGDIELKETAEPERFVTRTEKKTKKWTAEDYLSLLKITNNYEAASVLNRSEMSIRMKRGEFVPAFTKWAKEHNKNYLDSESIKEYLVSQNG